jgi:replicative DNA helicase
MATVTGTTESATSKPARKKAERSGLRLVEDLYGEPFPSDLETEQAVLGIALTAPAELPWNRVLDALYRHLSPSDFHVYPHAMLFTSLRRAHEKRVAKAGPIWFWQWFAKDGLQSRFRATGKQDRLVVVLAEIVASWWLVPRLGWYCEHLRRLRLERESRSAGLELAVRAHGLPARDWGRTAVNEANRILRLTDTIRPMRAEIEKQVALLDECQKRIGRDAETDSHNTGTRGVA